MSRFLITGLPRSRTAWLAVCTGAFHEPISHQGPGFLSEWEDGEGVSDAGAAPYLPFILRTLKPKTLIVERPISEVVESMAHYLGRPDLKETIYALLDESIRGLAVESPLVRRVDYHRLADLGEVEACLDWLEVKPPKNLAQLQHMVINSSLAYNVLIAQQKVA